jgi:MFS superfamily sulfate permease-like transporter
MSTKCLLRFSSHPRDAIFGLVPGLDGYNHIAGHAEARKVPGQLIYRFEAPLVFYNVENFTARVRALVSAAPEPLVRIKRLIEACGMAVQNASTLNKIF